MNKTPQQVTADLTSTLKGLTKQELENETRINELTQANKSIAALRSNITKDIHTIAVRHSPKPPPPRRALENNQAEIAAEKIITTMPITQDSGELSGWAVGLPNSGTNYPEPASNRNAMYTTCNRALEEITGAKVFEHSANFSSRLREREANGTDPVLQKIAQLTRLYIEKQIDSDLARKLAAEIVAILVPTDTAESK